MTEGAIQTISRHVKEYRYLLGLNQLQFAERCGLDVDRIRELEQGKGVTRNALELLRIAESCNVPYYDLFTRKDDTIVKKNADLPDGVLEGIKNLIDGGGIISRKDLAKKMGVCHSNISFWLNGVNSLNPFNFQNLITILNLNATKLEAMAAKQTEERPMVEEPAPESEEKIHPLSEPRPEPIGEEPDKEEPKATEITDPVDERIVKIMRLYMSIDRYLTQLDEIIKTASKLRDELAKLK